MKLDAFAIYTTGNSRIRVAIHGHTDSSAALNITLSENQAKNRRTEFVVVGK